MQIKNRKKYVERKLKGNERKRELTERMENKINQTKKKGRN